MAMGRRPEVIITRALYMDPIAMIIMTDLRAIDISALNLRMLAIVLEVPVVNVSRLRILRNINRPRMHMAAACSWRHRYAYVATADMYRAREVLVATWAVHLKLGTGRRFTTS